MLPSATWSYPTAIRFGAGRIEELATSRLRLVAPTRDEAIVIERVVPADPTASSVVARR